MFDTPYLFHLFEKFGELFWVKIAVALGFGTYTFLFQQDLGEVRTGLVVLIIMDSITGVFAAYKTGEEIESRKILRTAKKMILYFILVSAAFLAEKTIGIQFILNESVIAFLSLTEFVSILENIGKAGYKTPKKLLNKVKDLR